MTTPQTRPFARLLELALVQALTGILLLALPGCASDKPRPKGRAVTPVIRDVPSALRGTIGAEVTFRQIEPVLVSGFGLVVGLKGTGGGELPDRVAATMERELGLMGIGKAGNYQGTALEGKTPRAVLRDPNIAVVVVQAAIPPGAPLGYQFDVVVRALNNSAATSLEGGTLWTTDLKIGPPVVFGGQNTRAMAKARGAVFINPFADPGEEDSTPRSVGRVLNGGEMTNPVEILLALDNPSHSRAKSITTAINTRFPEGPRDRGPTARGREQSFVNVSIPDAYRDDPNEFINLIQYTQIDQRFPEEYARRYVEALKSQPWLGEELSWCLQALGKAALPFLRDLYEHAEVIPRLAALRAGARLGDAKAAPFLRDLATNGVGQDRIVAIGLLGALDAGPTVDVLLKEFLKETELDIRIAAYDALSERAERIRFARLVADERALPPAAGPARSYRELEQLAKTAFAGDTLQPVQPRLVDGDKFFIDIVPVGDPLIYITQQGERRVVLFGESLTLRKPLMVSAWSDRLMLTSEGESDGVRLYYRDYRTDRVTTQKVSEDIAELVEFFAQEPTPEDPAPGLALSYSEVVGALYAIQTAGGINAGFSTERDRLLSQILSASETGEPEDRPDTSGAPKKPAVLDPNFIPGLDGPATAEPPPSSDTPAPAAGTASK